MRRRRRERRAGLVLAVAAAAAGGGMLLGSTDPLQLSPGVTLEQALAAGESQTFQASLAAGRPYLVAVEQRGIHLVVDVRGPDGASLAAVDSPLNRWGVEAVLLRPAATGAYRIEVRGALKGVGPGRCEIRLDEPAEATPAEREGIAAWKAATLAGTLLRRATAGGLAQVLAAFEAARGHFHAAGNRQGEAEAVAALAAVTHRLGRQRQAVELYREAVARWQELGRPEHEIQAETDLGLTLWEMSELPAADESFARGLALARRLGSAYHEADLRADQCLILHARGEIQPALGCYNNLLELFEQLGETRDLATVLNDLGFAYFNLGEPAVAEERYRHALAIRRATGDRAGEAQALNNLAVYWRSVGEVDQSLTAYGEAREILATLDDRREEAAALNNLGVAYGSIGEVERARLYLTQALTLRHAVEDRRGEIVTLNNLGWLEQQSGAVDKAIPFHRQALAIARVTSDPRNEGLSRSKLGEALAAAGHAAEGLAELDQALALQRQTRDRYGEALTLRRQAEALAASRRTAEALPLFSQALLASRAVGDRVDEAVVLYARARTLRDLGDLDRAESDAAAAIAAFESLRDRLSNPELRAAFLASRSDVYELHVDILMRLAAVRPGRDFEHAALEASERARARSLLDVVQQIGAASLSSISTDLAAQRRGLEYSLTLKRDRRQNLLSRGNGEVPESKTLAIESERLQAWLDVVDTEIRHQSPRFGDLTMRFGVASVRQIQAELDPGTLLLEYSLGREQSYLWAVGPTTLRAFVLPGRAEIERAARAFHQALSTPAPPSGAAEVHEGPGNVLSRMLLAPVAGELGDRRLAFVADGALNYVPFGVLPEPGGRGQQAPLLTRHEVVELPSASVLVAERSEFTHRPAARQLAIVLADPVFEPDDPRVARSGRRLPAAAAASDRRGAGSELPLRLNRLRFSRQEAEAIAAQAPPGAVTTALDFAADRDLALSGRMSDFRYVHFATHGIFDAARPELSGLALSRVDAAGRPREGFLRLRDVYELDLAADLVVLSGCQTALGKEIRGEGLLGITRGFLYAGAPRVVASLWWIDDRATAALMTDFYRGMWAEGLRPAAALRQACLALARQHRFHDPAYWGAFVFQGDWR